MLLVHTLTKQHAATITPHRVGVEGELKVGGLDVLEPDAAAVHAGVVHEHLFEKEEREGRVRVERVRATAGSTQKHDKKKKNARPRGQ